jgi:3,4-dihydroxy-9,10-secoandrosta-1,3,5(10)-triene-9,17-dione 4,5-dioxygenase
MTVSTLGYVIVESSDLAQWRAFATDTIGLMEGAPGPDGSLRLRIDERPFRIAIVPGSADRFVAAGWEFADEAALAGCLDRLRKAGVAVTAASPGDAANRAVRSLYRCKDPSDNLLELYAGRHIDYLPFASPRGLSGFVAGGQGMGHVVLPAPKLEETRAFYRQHLGFGDSDQMWLQMSPNPADPKLGLYFMHANNPRHHSLALMGAPMPSGCVHIMLQANSLDDVGYALDRCLAKGFHISSSLGKHSNDLMVSFYARTPGGFDLEFGCHGLEVDWSTWVPTTSLIPDLWGHRWSPPQASTRQSS